MKIFSRFKSFRVKNIALGSIPTMPDHMGLSLNMREFLRALTIGTSKTKRTKNTMVQTNMNTQHKSTQCGPQDFIDTPDLIFSEETEINSQGFSFNSWTVQTIK